LIAVDTFFFVGGFLVTYSIIKNIKNHKKGFKFYLLAILQRALRFWPSYIFIILIYYSIYLHLGSGPQWPN
jgi:peptidoglycan/LPS O-acetylase OafA/YrhL